jgi:hypothetical protein
VQIACYALAAVERVLIFSFELAAGSRISTFSYFSFTTLSTLGYGDITPVTSGVRQLAIL